MCMMGRRKQLQDEDSPSGGFSHNCFFLCFLVIYIFYVFLIQRDNLEKKANIQNMKEKTIMKKAKIISIVMAIICICTILSGCDGTKSAGTRQNIRDTQTVTDNLTISQQTPTDIEYSLERYNLIRRAYWVNGMEEKARNLECPVVKPLGYIALCCGETILTQMTVDGKVSSLNSFLSPNYVESYYSSGAVVNTELADVDGSYGENIDGVFFFTAEGEYFEWNGKYLYGSVPFEIKNPILQVQYN